jgi:alkylhydroperoxidase family enzyme
MTSPADAAPTHPRYANANVEIRSDLSAAHDALLAYIASSGPSLTGSERVALVLESRHGLSCPLCIERKAALSPEHPPGEHATVTDLRAPLVEMAHRICTDPQRLSQSWCERMQAAGLSEAEYVEAVGIITFAAGIDAFCRAIGIEPFGMLDGSDATPTAHVPSGLRDGIAWVSMLAPEDCSGPEAELYPKLDMVPNIARALSRIPDHARMLQTLTRSHYVDLSELSKPWIGKDLDRMQIELIASRVSAINECFY